MPYIEAKMSFKLEDAQKDNLHKKLEDVISENIERLLPIDFDLELLEIKYDGLNQLSYKILEGEKIGTISYYYDNVLYGDEDVFAPKIEPTFFEKIKNLIKNNLFVRILSVVLMIGIVLMLFIAILVIKKKKRKRRRRRRR